MASCQITSSCSQLHRPFARPVVPAAQPRAEVFARSGAREDDACSSTQPGHAITTRSSNAVRQVSLSVAAVSAAMLLAQPALANEAAALAAEADIPEAFIQGFLLIFFSELGDKTFFIALLLALQRDKGSVFIGTFGALGIMTVISVALGRVLHELDELVPQGMVDIPWDDVLAVVLLTYFGINTILDAKNADEKAAEEKKDAEEEVTALQGVSTGIILSTFLLVFAAEWGDKSFLATIALAATSNPVGVTAGAVTGHGAATALAVAGGGVLSKNVSEVVIQYAGGILFLVFAAVSTIQIAERMQIIPQLVA